MSAEFFSFSSDTGSDLAQQTFHLLVSNFGGAGAYRRGLHGLYMSGAERASEAGDALQSVLFSVGRPRAAVPPAPSRERREVQTRYSWAPPDSTRLKCQSPPSS